MDRKYIVRTALREEVNEGWVWQNQFPSQTILSIFNPETGIFIICEARKIDDNFTGYYGASPKRIPIVAPDETIVISNWYRSKLGIVTSADNQECNRTRLCITRHPRQRVGAVQAQLQHPNSVVRVATQMGVLGAVLGIVGFILSVISMMT